MRLQPSLSSGAYTKRKATPAGTLTSKKVDTFNFSRSAINSDINNKDHELISTSDLFPYSFPPSTCNSVCSKTSVSMQSGSIGSPFYNEHTTDFAETTTEFLEDALESAILQQKNLVCKKYCNGAGCSTAFKNVVKNRRKCKPLEITGYICIEYCREHKDFLFQAIHVFSHLSSEISRVKAALENKQTLNKKEKLALSVLYKSLDMIQNKTIISKSSGRITTRVRSLVAEISEYVQVVVLLDGVDTFHDRDNEGTNYDDVQDFLVCFPPNVTLLLSAQHNYGLCNTWEASGFLPLDFPVVQQHQKLGILEGLLKDRSYNFVHLINELVVSELFSPLEICLVSKYVVRTIDKIHFQNIEIKNGYPTNAIKSETADSGIIEIEDTIESCCLFMKSVYLRQGLHGIIECTLDQLEEDFGKNGRIVKLFAYLILSPLPVAISKASLISGMPSRTIVQLVEQNPALLKWIDEGEAANETVADHRIFSFATYEAWKTIRYRYYATTEILHNVQALYVRGLSKGMTCLTYALCISLENDIEFETNIKFVTAVSLLNSTCVQLHRNSPYVALAMVKECLEVLSLLRKKIENNGGKARGATAIATLERICDEASSGITSVLPNSKKQTSNFSPDEQGTGKLSSHPLMERPITRHASSIASFYEGLKKFSKSIAISRTENDRTLASQRILAQTTPQSLIDKLQKIIDTEKLSHLEHTFKEGCSRKSKKSGNTMQRKRVMPRLIKVEKINNRHIKKIETASIRKKRSLNSLTLNRHRFFIALRNVFSIDEFTDDDIQRVFDIMSWEPDDLHGSTMKTKKSVSWQTFVDLLQSGAEESKFQNIVWERSDQDCIIDPRSLLSRPKRFRFIMDKIIDIPQCDMVLRLAKNGLLSVYNKKKNALVKHLSLFDKAAFATDICYIENDAVCAVSVRRDDPPAFSGIYFFEPLVDWQLSETKIIFKGLDSPPTAISSYYGSVPAQSHSGKTTEMINLFMIGCEDGTLRIGTLQDFVHDIQNTMTVTLQSSSSMISTIQYVSDFDVIVCGSMDGNVYLYFFEMVGSIVSGLTIRQRKSVRVFNHHSRPVLSLQYLKESHSILSAGLDEVILLWGIADFSILSYIKTGVSSKCAVALEDIGQVVSLDANVTLLNGHFHQGFRVWNLFGGKNLQIIELTGSVPIAPLVMGSKIEESNIKGACGSLIYDTSGEEFILGSHSLRRLVKKKHFRPNIFATHEKEIIGLFVLDRYVDQKTQSVAYLNDSSAIRILSISILGSVRVWNCDSGNICGEFSVLKSLKISTKIGIGADSTIEVSSAICDSSCEKLFVGYTNGLVASWRILNGIKLKQYFACTKSPVSSLCISRDSATLCGSLDNGYRITWATDEVCSDTSDSIAGKFVRPLTSHLHETQLNSICITQSKGITYYFCGDKNKSLSFWKHKISNPLDIIDTQWYFGKNRPEVESGITAICQLIDFPIPTVVLSCTNGYIRVYHYSNFCQLQLLAQRYSGGLTDDDIPCISLSCKYMSTNNETGICQTQGKAKVQHYKIAVADKGGGLHVWICSIIKFKSLATQTFPVEMKREFSWNINTNNHPSLTLGAKVYASLIDLCQNLKFVVAAATDNRVYMYLTNGTLLGTYGQSTSWIVPDSLSPLEDTNVSLKQANSEVNIQPTSSAMSPLGYVRKVRREGVFSMSDNNLGPIPFSRESTRWKTNPELFLKNTIKAINVINDGVILDDKYKSHHITSTEGLKALKRLAAHTVSPSLITKSLYARRPVTSTYPGDDGENSTPQEVHRYAKMLPQTPLQVFKKMQLHTKDS